MQFGKQEAKNKMNTHNDRFLEKNGLGHEPGGTCRRNMINKFFQQEMKKPKQKQIFIEERVPFQGLSLILMQNRNCWKTLP